MIHISKIVGKYLQEVELDYGVEMATTLRYRMYLVFQRRISKVESYNIEAPNILFEASRPYLRHSEPSSEGGRSPFLPSPQMDPTCVNDAENYYTTGT